MRSRRTFRALLRLAPVCGLLLHGCDTTKATDQTEDVAFLPQTGFMRVNSADGSYSLVLFDCASGSEGCLSAPRCREPAVPLSAKVEVDFAPQLQPGTNVVYRSPGDFRARTHFYSDGEYSSTRRDHVVELEIEVLNLNAGDVSGELVLRDAGGNPVRVAYSVPFCPSRVVPRNQAPPIHGRPFEMELVDPNGLPDEPLTGSIAGSPFTAESVVIERYQRTSRIVFYSEELPVPCDSESLRRIYLGLEEPTEEVDYLAYTFPDDQRPLDSLEGRNLVGNMASRRSGDGAGCIHSYEPEQGRAVNLCAFWNVAIVIDSVDAAAQSVRGRAYLAFDDPAKAFAVGAFEGTVCELL